jgi:hypothetical protein
MNNYKVLLLLTIFFVSNRYYNPQESLDVGLSDINTYLSISGSAPAINNNLNFPSHRLERWIPHWLIGIIAKASTVDVWIIYRLVVLFLFLFLIIEVYKKSKNNSSAIISILLIALNPYSFRIYLASPAMISDALFLCSLFLIVIGKMKRKNGFQYVGIIFGAIAKQSILLLIPFYLFDIISNKANYSTSVKMIFVTMISFLILRTGSNQFYLFTDSQHMYFKHIFGVINNYYLTEEGLNELVLFFAKYSLFLVTVFLVFYKNILINRKNLLYIFGFFIFHLQPILGGPSVTGGNIQRLCALSLPMLFPLINSKEYLGFNQKTIISLLVLASFHYNYSILANLPSSKFIYLFIVSLSVFIIVIMSLTNKEELYSV